MKNPHVSILLIENDLPTCDLIAGQFLHSADFQVQVAHTASDAFQSISILAPDIIISNLNLPDLNANDILITLALQGLEIPVIVYAEKGKDHEVVQAIRVGAAGYFPLPPGEAEFSMVLNRALNLVRAGKNQDLKIDQLAGVGKAPDKKNSEIDTIFAIKKGLTSTRSLDDLINKTLEAAIYISHADCGWLLMRQGSNEGFTLSAHSNVPQILVDRIRQNWDDGLSSIVAFLGDPLSGYGSQLEFSLISQCGGAAMVSPIKIGRELIGLLIIISKTPIQFSEYRKNMLEIVAMFASVGYANSRGIRIH